MNAVKFISVIVGDGETGLVNASDIVTISSAKKAAAEGIKAQDGLSSVLYMRNGNAMAVYDSVSELAEQLGCA